MPRSREASIYYFELSLFLRLVCLCGSPFIVVVLFRVFHHMRCSVPFVIFELPVLRFARGRALASIKKLSL